MSLFPDHLRFGIHAGQQHSTYPEYLELWQTAEQLGFDWASVFDHFMPIRPAGPTGPCFEGPTLLAAMAARTQHLRIGIIVTGVTYRHPAVAANIAATIDHISGGRLEWGIGGAWFELEHDQYGIPFPRIGERLAMMGEAAEVMKLLWQNERTSYEGKYYTLKQAMLEPKPLQERIPLWIGGSGEKVTLRHVARIADGWNTFLSPLDEFDHKLEVLGGHCDAVGRDPKDIRIQAVTQLVLGADEQEAAEQLRARAEGLGVSIEAMSERGMRGYTPEQLVEHLRPYVDRGVQDFLLFARPPMDRRTLELFSSEVAPALRG